MIGYAESSTLRLIDFFPGDPRVEQFYATTLGEEGMFAIEMLNGAWESIEVPGVEMLYPQADGSKLGAIFLRLPIPRTR